MEVDVMGRAEDVIAAVKARSSVSTLLPPPKVERMMMIVDDWIEVEDCPMQRDTAARAKKAQDYLRRPLPTHYEVSAARYGDKLIKLDGHTRALLWKEGTIDRICDSVNVTIYTVNSLAEMRSLYESFDSKLASKTAYDNTLSAVKSNGLVLSSTVLRTARFGQALNVASQLPASERYEQVRMFVPELEMLDELNMGSSSCWNPHIAAALLTLKLHGPAARDFWHRVNHNDGCSEGGVGDPVFTVNQLTLKSRGKVGQYHSFQKLVHQLLWLCDRFVRDPHRSVKRICETTVTDYWQRIRTGPKQEEISMD